MFEAQYLFDGNAVFSPWMARGADNITISVDLIAKVTSDLMVTLYEKNSEDVGDGSPHGDGTLSVTMVTTTGPAEKTYLGVKELVRYKIEADNGSGTDRVLYRILAPVWFDSVRASS